VRDRSGAPPPARAPFPESGDPSRVPPRPAVPFPELWSSPDAPTSDAVPFPDSWDSPDALPSTGVAFPELRGSSGAPPSAAAVVPELGGAAEPAPPARSRGSRLLRTLARVVLWSLVAVGALRGLLPATDDVAQWAVPRERRQAATPGGSQDERRAASGDPRGGQRAAAVAVAFLREYLTVGEDQAARAERLGRYGVAGAELRGSVAVPAGVSQYADLVVAAGGRSVADGVEITVLAHVLQLRSGTYRDGGTLAFVVPLAVRQEGIAVTGRPRPTSLPVGSGLPSSRPRTAPARLSPAAGRLARQAVVALVNGDRATLARLGGGRVPATRPLPGGWRALRIGTAEAAGPPAALATASGTRGPGAVSAIVPVRIRPPTGPVGYLVQILVRLDRSPGGLTVRQVDAGGSP
jgi:hypothetical protein